MTQTIQQFELFPNCSNFLSLPADAKVLGVHRDGGTVMMCVQVPIDLEGREIRTRHFPIYKTNDPVPDEYVYVGTVKVLGDTYHIFERPCGQIA